MSSQEISLIVPAYNEKLTIGGVVKAAKEEPNLFGERIFVVDDGSADNTADIAVEAGAVVIVHKCNLGKAAAIKTGLENISTDFVCLVDADLLNLRARHLWELVYPVVYAGTTDTNLAVIGTLAQILFPSISGQRCIRTNLLKDFNEWGTGFGFEVCLNRHLYKKGVKQHRIYWRGVSQVIKEEKEGLVKGLISRFHMYRQIICAYMRY